MIRTLPHTIAIVLVTLASPGALAKVTFEEHVKPILREQCAGCHNQDSAASGLALDGFGATLEGGAGGEVVVPGDPDASRLWRLVNHDEEPVMPPGADKLPEKQLAVIREWIEGGLLKDAGSKPMASKRAAIAAVDPASLGKPQGEPAMPAGWFREPVLTAPAVGPIDSLAASPWAPLVATPWQRQVSLYHTATHELLGVIPYLDGAPRVVRFSRDGSLLLVAGGRDAATGSAALFDVKSGARLATVGDELDAVLAADLSADNTLVALGGPNKKVRVYRVADGEVAYTCAKHTDWITTLAFSPDGKQLATGDRASGLRLWDAAEGYERNDLRGHKGAITAIAWRRDGGLLASASEDGSVRLWNPEGKQIKSINAHGGGGLSVAFAADGRFVTAGRDRKVKVWKPDGGHLADVATMPDLALAAVFTHDGAQVIASDWTGGVRAIDIEKKETVAPLAPNPPRLAQRLAEAASLVDSSEKSLTESQAKLDETLAALEAGRARHAEHDKKVADAQLAATDAAKVAGESAKSVAQRGKGLKSASEALAKAKQAFVAAREAVNGDQVKTTDAEEAERLANALDAAREKRNAAREAVAAAKELVAADQKAAAESNKQKRDAEALLAKVVNQSAGLPDLEQLEAGVSALQTQLVKKKAKIASAQEEHDAINAEISAFTQAAERLAGEAEAARQERDHLAQEAEQAASQHATRTEASQRVTETVDRLREQIATLRQELSDLREEQKGAHSALTESQEGLEASQAAVADAQRRAQLAESLLEDLRAADAWREEHPPAD
ncbi:Chromosome partition protein Smc [Planctomycetes bacterium MalM25]|nr:Chromosome partition protein Smc [Planctomycetes bacterium MalM25]